MQAHRHFAKPLGDLVALPRNGPFEPREPFGKRLGDPLAMRRNGADGIARRLGKTIVECTDVIGESVEGFLRRRRKALVHALGMRGECRKRSSSSTAAARALASSSFCVISLTRLWPRSRKCTSASASFRQAVRHLVESRSRPAQGRGGPFARLVELPGDMAGKSLAGFGEMRIDLAETLNEVLRQLGIGALKTRLDGGAGFLKPGEDILALRRGCQSNSPPACASETRISSALAPNEWVIWLPVSLNSRSGRSPPCRARGQRTLVRRRSRAHPLAVGEHRFAFGRQFVDQRTDPALVLR